ncbi:expressed unknown protein [Seminavis robusta]|uniref:Nuclear transport factor 2 family protein n=1 Tax=Seminavis robusta TaxID=568900 RepID=A0A9N8DA03_9STRA|nr:expressed unknown protein [Seminavis robusta]|eukprot:Sro58_g033900.1 n/a (153) ;mRNA; f:128023-128607
MCFESKTVGVQSELSIGPQRSAWNSHTRLKAASEDDEAEAAVRKVAEAYEAGTRARDIDALKAVFAPEASMSGWLGDQMLCGSPQPYFDFVAANEVADDYTAEIVSVTVNGKIAFVETKESNLFGMEFSNYLHLLQYEDNSWKITAKLFRHY